MNKTLSTFAFVGAVALVSAIGSAAESSKQTVTVRAGQGDVVTVVVPTRPERTNAPYALTGQRSSTPANAVTMRTGQGGFVQVPLR